jgi:predicted ATPase
LALYDCDWDRSLAFAYMADFRVNALSLLSLTLLSLGYPERALALNREALAYTRQLSHVQSFRLAVSFACLFFGLARDMESLEACAETMTSIGTTQNLPDSLLAGHLHRACVLAQRGQLKEGVALWTQSSAARRAAGQERETPLAAILLAEAYQKAGQPSEGLRVLEDPLGRVEYTREGWIEPELHRVRGELLLAPPADADPIEAEACFQCALGVARSQAAKMWELRAATSLARLWCDQGRRAQAHDMLAPVYGWFTEGFDTADLKEPNGLLNELA